MLDFNKLYITLLFLLICLHRQGIAQTQITVMADKGYPPYSFISKGKLTGIYTDILKEVFSNLKDYQIKMKPIDWKKGLGQMRGGEGFALYPPYKRKDRPFMSYTVPILDEELSIFCNSRVFDKTRDQWPKSFYGLRISRNTGFSTGKSYEDAVKAGYIIDIQKRTNYQNLVLLIFNHTDCYVNDGAAIAYELNKLQRRGKYEGKGIDRGITISSEAGYLGISKNHQKFKFIDHFTNQYNQQMNLFKQSEKFKKILEKYGI